MKRDLVLALLFVVVCASSAFAQLASQTALVGTVTDGGGLPMPGASVVAVNQGTQDRYETTTNTDGYYNIQFVRIGTYQITVSLAGFRTFTANGVQVATNQIVRTNAALQVGGVSETIEVEAKAATLATDSASGRGDDRQARGRRSAVANGRNVW